MADFGDVFGTTVTAAGTWRPEDSRSSVATPLLPLNLSH
jgi:hypothetical protein